MSYASDLRQQDTRRLRDFVLRFTEMLVRSTSEEYVLSEGTEMLRELVRVDDWLPEQFAQPDPERYRQYLLYADPHDRFSIVSFVWGPGQMTPIHDHTVWGLIGMLRGSEQEQHYVFTADGMLTPAGAPQVLLTGQVDVVSPSVGDLHRVSNAYKDRVSISIHIYGANIGKVERSVYELSGARKHFMSGYSNTQAPDLWSTQSER